MTPKEVVEAFVDAHNRHDVAGMLALLADDAVTIDPASPIPLHGKDDVRRLYEAIFTSVPDIDFAVTVLVAEGDRVFAAFRTTGTGSGTFQGRDVDGRKIDVQEAMLARIAGGRIAWAQFYSDTATLMAQLGYETAASRAAAGG